MPWENEPKNWMALIGGILLTALGLLPLLNKWGILAFPYFSSNLFVSLAAYVIAAGGIWLLIDSFMEDDAMRVISIIVAIVLIILGLIPVLATFKVIGFNIPFLTTTFYHILFVVEGFFLMISAFTMQM